MASDTRKLATQCFKIKNDIMSILADAHLHQELEMPVRWGEVLADAATCLGMYGKALKDGKPQLPPDTDWYHTTYRDYTAGWEDDLPF